MSDEDEFDQFALNGMTMPSKYKSVFLGFFMYEVSQDVLQ